MSDSSSKIEEKKQVKIWKPPTQCMRPSINAVRRIFEENVKGKIFNLPKTKNKGLPGQKLEEKLGIPLSSTCLDCCDGELKLFPLKKLCTGIFSPKETVAITMRGLNRAEIPNPVAWKDSALKKKTDKMLFISFLLSNLFIFSLIFSNIFFINL